MADSVNRLLGSENGRMFVLLNYVGNNFSERLLGHTDAKQIMHCNLWQFMTQNGHEDTDAGSSPNDLHHSFVDFVARVAGATDLGARPVTGRYETDASFLDSIKRSGLGDVRRRAKDALDRRADEVASGEPMRYGSDAEAAARAKQFGGGATEALSKMSPAEFAATLPLAVVGSKAYYTDEGVVKSEAITQPNYLEKLYMDIITGKVHRTVPTDAPWKINVKLVKNFLKNAVERRAGPGSSLDDLLGEEIGSKSAFRRNLEGKLVDRKGEVLNTETREDNCYGTGFNSGACNSIMKCIIGGNTNTRQVAECLKNLAGANKWEEARKDIAAHDPKLAVEMLRSFGVKGEKVVAPNGQDVTVPVTGDKWLASLPKETVQALQASEGLCEYVKGVIHCIRENPALINKNYRGEGVTTEDPSPYLDALKVPYFQKPNRNPERLEFAYHLLRGAAPIRGEAMVPLFGGGNFGTNVRLGGGNYTSMSGGCFQTGGDLDSLRRRVSNGDDVCVDGQKRLFDELEKDLASAGYHLKRSEQEAIERELGKLAQLEKKLGKVHDILAKLVDIKDLYGLPDHVGPTREISIADIRTESQLRDYVVNNIVSLRNYAGNNLKLQANVANYVRSLFLQVLGSATGIRSTAISVPDVGPHRSGESVALDSGL